jgi:haloalkane dehalogenase
MPTVHRTPDAAFEGLADFPFPPNYLEWDGLRTHYLDEGPRDGPVALLMHGEPTWSYLYRRMIPGLVAAGYRCIAPDHIGFGRSDKVLEDDWYVIDRHLERVRGLISRLDLTDITLFCQDWGGPTSLIPAMEMPERFSRLVILNTWLHHEGFDYGPGIRMWREAATSRFWLGWTGGDQPCGAIVASAAGRPPADRAAIIAAYEAPFDLGGKTKAGARRFPWCIPFAEPEAGAAEAQARAFEQLKGWTGPAHFIFGESDRVFTADWGRQWSGMIAGATFDSIPDAGHFVQEDAGEEIIEIFLRRRAG